MVQAVQKVLLMVLAISSLVINEAIHPGFATSQKTGSHNMIVGFGNNYTSYGSIVAGLWNQSLAPYASITSSSGSVLQVEIFPMLLAQRQA